MKDADALVRFLENHRGTIAARVRREVTNQLATGLKTPKRGRAASTRRPSRAGAARHGAAR
jgi:hypothetical protein